MLWTLIIGLIYTECAVRCGHTCIAYLEQDDNCTYYDTTPFPSTAIVANNTTLCWHGLKECVMCTDHPLTWYGNSTNDYTIYVSARCGHYQELPPNVIYLPTTPITPPPGTVIIGTVANITIRGKCPLFIMTDRTELRNLTLSCTNSNTEAITLIGRDVTIASINISNAAVGIKAPLSRTGFNVGSLHLLHINIENSHRLASLGNVYGDVLELACDQSQMVFIQPIYTGPIHRMTGVYKGKCTIINFTEYTSVFSPRTELLYSDPDAFDNTLATLIEDLGDTLIMVAVFEAIVLLLFYPDVVFLRKEAASTTAATATKG